MTDPIQTTDAARTTKVARRRKTRAPAPLEIKAPLNGSMPYLNELADYRLRVMGERTRAEREREDLLAEIQRLDVEISARRERVAIKEQIIAGCDASIESIMRQPEPERPAPQLTARTSEDAWTRATDGDGGTQTS